MKKSIILGISGVLMLTACGNKQEKETVSVPKAIVEAVSFKSGTISEETSFQAQSVYLIKNAVIAPINSYVQKVFVRQGEKVKAGQVLYELATKERKATENLQDSTYRNLGIIHIKASNSGIVSSITSQLGDYVTEGAQMCQISNAGSLVFTLQVPYEYNCLIRSGLSCVVELPDGKDVQGKILNELDQMSLNGQTRQYIVKTQNVSFIPENLLATVRIKVKTISSMQILPLGCVLSDELMQNFWVMKMINDSTAVKVAVKTGLKNKNELEITEPVFSSADKILSSGNYGLADTALVNITK